MTKKGEMALLNENLTHIRKKNNKVTGILCLIIILCGMQTIHGKNWINCQLAGLNACLNRYDYV